MGPPLRNYKSLSGERRRGRSRTGPCSGRPRGLPLQFERTALITGAVPLIRHASRDTFPLGEGLRAGEDTRPYGESGICRGRTLAGPSMYAARPGGRALQFSTSRHLLDKARRGSGTAASTIFHQTRTQWSGGNLERHSDFARRKFCKIQQVRVPRNGGSRGRATWRREALPNRRLRPPLAALW